MLKNKVLKFVTKNKLFGTKDHLLIAVSGGIDSMCLLQLFNDLKYNISVAHCNFNLRALESNEDQKLVQDYCKRNKIPFYVKSFSTLQEAEKNKDSIQVTARNLRYEWFKDLAFQIRADKILTAHHLGDQMETFFINLSRGTGLKGLSGIPKKRGNIVRPLLEITKMEIEQYVKEQKIPYRNDSSNADEKYLRNKIRLKLIPFFKEINPAFENSFLQTQTLLSQVADLWDERYLNWKNKNVVESNGNYIVTKTNSNFLSYFLMQHEFTATNINSILAKDLASGKTFFSDNWKLLVDRKTYILSPLNSVQIANKESEPVLEFINRNSLNEIAFSNEIIAIDKSKIQGAFKLRKWKRGDKFVPFGMKGSKKVSDFFIDQKINRLDKGEIWLLCDEKNIIWIIGLRMDNRYRVTKKTSSILEIRLKD